MKKKILYNGELIDDLIQTHTGSSFFNYGTGFFETILYQNKRLFFWADHVKRMQHAAEVFEFSLCKEWLDENLVYNLIKRNRCEHITLRVKILCGPLREAGIWDIIVFVNEYKRDNKDYTIFIHWEPKDGFFCNFKSVNYQALSYWRNYYKNHFNADEVLFLSFDHKVLEASASNILVVKDSTLYFIDIHDNYLAGVMQKNIVKEHKECGFSEAIPIKSGFTLDFLENAEEILLSNSLIIAQRVAGLHTGTKKRKFMYKDYGWARKIREYFLVQ